MLCKIVCPGKPLKYKLAQPPVELDSNEYRNIGLKVQNVLDECKASKAVNPANFSREQLIAALTDSVSGEKVKDFIKIAVFKQQLLKLPANKYARLAEDAGSKKGCSAAPTGVYDRHKDRIFSSKDLSKQRENPEKAMSCKFLGFAYTGQAPNVNEHKVRKIFKPSFLSKFQHFLFSSWCISQFIRNR